MKASEVLRKAKDLIGTPDKWCKGSQLDECGRRCVHGAINCVTGRDTYAAENFAAWSYLGDLVGWPSGKGMGIAVWNNASTTTHADVMAAFDRAIKLAEADERKDWTEADTRRVLSEIVATVPTLGVVVPASEV